MTLMTHGRVTRLLGRGGVRLRGRDRVEHRGGIRERVVGAVGVGAESKPGVLMPEPRGEHHDGHAAHMHERCTRVPGIVKSDMRETGGL